MGKNIKNGIYPKDEDKFKGEYLVIVNNKIRLIIGIARC